MLSLELPYPPSVNHYWRHVGPRVLISREGRLYRERAGLALAQMGLQPLRGLLVVSIEAYPPDKRRRDLDNLLKSLLDSLQHGGAFVDDSQIVDLRIVKRAAVPNGRVIVHIEELKNANVETR